MVTVDSFRLMGGIFLLVALLSGQLFYFALGGFFFFLVYVHRWWIKQIPKLIHITCTSDQVRVMPHTPITLKVLVQNHSYLPLPATKLVLTLPLSVKIEGADSCNEENKQHHVQIFMHIPPRAQATREITLVPSKRGVIWFSEIKVELISPFVTEVCNQTLPTTYTLLVYPEIIPIPPYQQGAFEPLGKHLSRQRLQDDPSFIRGTRTYMPGDRLKNIDWRATAKTSFLQTRLFEYTSQQKWMIVGHILPIYEAKLQRFHDLENEKLISAVASVATRFRQEKIPYTLYLNVRQRGKDVLQLAEGSGKAHYVHVMTQLAKMHQFMPTSIIGALRRLEIHTQKLSILLISSRFDEDMALVTKRLILRGHEIILLDMADENPVFRLLKGKPVSNKRATTPKPTSSPADSSSSGKECVSSHDG
ncbi:DUF58 domain-containing protein [Brevibacillus laterosporus]|uniref:DUF58 domain-containing protein n=1 Tax=Brevibacillus laterosporus TaxID=1465 RepID=UPI000361CE76|nr:DUF58 domain-containing protein [Brevibacillus laterosporus]ATO49719.1 hypothetical protein BrL25_11790 [Brevibacillus laterosporus DSM 25]MED2001775.1 DUF58 domain-containing protein [Brevibacillus laterosporus]MED4765809.1 DUF58 domain-containing protein [Brevibacillus laterosporus]TPH10601.1 DUF58 domain-containing protein [Brevibacillus laterosporus]